MLQEQGEFYTHSGKITTSCIIGIASAIGAAMVLGIIYAYATFYIPLIYINVVITIGCGFVLGYAIAKLMLNFKCRNHMFCLVAGGIGGLACLYASWVGFAYIFFNKFYPQFNVTFTKLLTSPGGLWNFAVDLSKTGWFSMGSSSSTDPSYVKGVFLWIIWIIEAGIIVGAAVIMSAGAITEEVFCEKCDKWASKREDVEEFLAEDPDMVIDKALAGDVSFIYDVHGVSSNEPYYLGLDVFKCNKCKELHAFTINGATRTWDENGNESLSKEAIIRHRLISGEDMAILLNPPPMGANVQEEPAQEYYQQPEEQYEQPEAQEDDPYSVG